jgi:hypothetical protein
MLFNGEQIMTAGEIRRPAIGPISESAKPSAHRAWTVLGESSEGIALSDWHEDYAIAEVAAVLADDQDVSPRTRAAVEGLLHRHRLLAEELSRQRSCSRNGFSASRPTRRCTSSTPASRPTHRTSS